MESTRIDFRSGIFVSIMGRDRDEKHSILHCSVTVFMYIHENIMAALATSSKLKFVS